jgi:hypothetical protein
VGPVLEMLHPVEVYDGRTMDSEEPRRIERRLQLGQSRAQHGATRPGMDPDGRAHCLDPVDRADVQERGPACGLQREPGAMAGDHLADLVEHAPRLRCPNGLLGPRQRLTKPGVGERLQEVVHRAELEGADRVRIVRRDKHHQRDMPLGHRLEHLEPVHARHLHIKEQEIGPGLQDEPGRGRTGGLAHQFDLRVGLEQASEGPARHRLVVHHQRADPGRLSLWHPASIATES